jgi:hypothetical protein
VTVAVSVSEANDRLSGVIVTFAAVCVTVTEAVALSDPLVAVIVAVPSATEVTRPEEETVATDADEVAHDTLAPDIVAPFWSLTVADSCCVAPKDEKLGEVGDSVIEVATGGGGVGGAVGSPSPQARSKSTVESRIHLIRIIWGTVCELALVMPHWPLNGGYCNI